MRETPFIPKIKVLHIFDCYELVDVTNLSHLQQLNGFNAESITDFSALGGNQCGELVCCSRIESVSSFEKVERLK